MTQSTRGLVPGGYQIRVAGHLDHHWAAWFGDLTLTHEDDGTTSIAGQVSDQAQLHGLLTKVRDLGVTLISVERLDASDREEPVPSSRPFPGGKDVRTRSPGI